ncbi:MAG: hypothetical protein HYR98_06395, partial [Nitrospirae bacterium]|nr:hypothetical protein [Nitrospirota bacterium]
MRRLLLRLFPWIPSPGLGSKIFWAVLALTLVAVTLMAVVVDRLAGKILRERVERELALRADRTVREISLYLEEQSREAVGLAQVPTVKEVLAALDRGDVFRVDELLSLNGYPPAHLRGAFYGQSAALVQFLV